MGLNLLIVDVSKSHSLDTGYFVRILWTSSLRENTKHSQETDVPAAEFESSIPPSEGPQSYALHRAATRICL